MNLRRAWCLSFCAFLLAGLLGFAEPANNINISTPAFAPGESIPAKYAYKGQNVSPELRIGNVPANAKSLVLIVDDPDAPMGIWTHWLVWNLPPNTTDIPEGKLPADAREGKNSFGHDRYDGPAPPSGTHRYFFRLYALDEPFFPKFRTASEREAILAEIKGHIVGYGETFWRLLGDSLSFDGINGLWGRILTGRHEIMKYMRKTLSMLFWDDPCLLHVFLLKNSF